NLIGNAVKHAPPRSAVTCQVHVVTGQAVVRVCDRGPGLTAGDLECAFRPFTRLSAAAEGDRASFGLGLWIARLVAERHGGGIEAGARPDGQGAMFTLRLPLAAPSRTAARRDTARSITRS